MSTKYITLELLADAITPRKPNTALEIIDTEYIDLFKDLPGGLQTFAGITDKELNDLHYHGVMFQALADKLAKAFNTTPEYWANIQNNANAYKKLYGNIKHSSEVVMVSAKEHNCDVDKIVQNMATIKYAMGVIRKCMENIDKDLVSGLGCEGSLTLKESELDHILKTYTETKINQTGSFTVNDKGILGECILPNTTSVIFKLEK